MKFEEKINTLETLINELEANNGNLDEAIEKYTKAMKLVKECDKELKNIEDKITKMVNSTGELEELEVE